MPIICAKKTKINANFMLQLVSTVWLTSRELIMTLKSGEIISRPLLLRKFFYNPKAGGSGAEGRFFKSMYYSYPIRGKKLMGNGQGIGREN